MLFYWQKKPPASPAASLQEPYKRTQSHQPADQRHQPEDRQQQAMIGTVPDARPVIPAYRVPVAHPQRGLHPPPSHQIVPHTHAPPAHRQRLPAAVSLQKSAGVNLPITLPFRRGTPCHPQGRSESGAGAALTGVIP